MLHNAEYNFSSCNIVGRFGPNQSQIDSEYSHSTTKVQIVGNGIQKWTVPFTGLYSVTAAGASGGTACAGNNGGRGALLLSSFIFRKGTILYILVGQQGITFDRAWGGFGGGGTFVVKKVSASPYYFNPDKVNVDPLLIASGGGGSGDCNSGNAVQKQGYSGLSDIGKDISGVSKETGCSGGGSFSQDAQHGTKSFLNGGIGGTYTDQYSDTSEGGFGCGGEPNNSGGGGGGYQGGSALDICGGSEGGYSFDQGKTIYHKTGFNVGNGYAKISLINDLYNETCHLAQFYCIICYAYITLLSSI